MKMARPNVPSDEDAEETPPNGSSSEPSQPTQRRRQPRLNRRGGTSNSPNSSRNTPVRRVDTTYVPSESEGAVGYSPALRGSNDNSDEHNSRTPSATRNSDDNVFFTRSVRRTYSEGEVENINRNAALRNIPNSESVTMRHRGSDSVLRNNAQSRNTDNHNHFRNNLESVDGVSRDTLTITSEIYLRFLRDEILRYDEQQRISCLDTAASVFEQPGAPYTVRLQIIETGSQLRRVADEFARSPHREEVRMRAETVCLESLNFQNFSDLLFGLFQEGGVTWERIVVLFFFCSDLAIRALRRQLLNTFHHLVDWGRSFVLRRLGVIVEEEGGWPAVLNQSVNWMSRSLFAITCAVTVFIIVSYLRRST